MRRIFPHLSEIDEAILVTREWAVESHVGETEWYERRRNMAWMLCDEVERLQRQNKRLRKAAGGPS